VDPRTTRVAGGAKVVGAVESPGDLRIEGRVEGSIRCGAAVIIEEGGVAVCQIHAVRVDVRGVVIGDVIAGERIEVGRGARVVGDLRAPVIELDPDASIEGKIDRRLPKVETTEASTRATARLTAPLRRPEPPISVSGERPPLPPEPSSTPAPAPSPRQPPALPRPAARARMIPRHERKDDDETT
jgi:cytoskeletal protein CcmA (bactofilin family)